MNKHNLVVILGAADPEMKEIQRVCMAENIPFSYATLDGWIVKPFQAYAANGTLRELPKNADVVTVECSVEGVTPKHKIDHHHEGDAGYGKGPDQFLMGSSLGQFLNLIGLKPTHKQLIIAAADHCLTAAYQGKCPGVSVEDLRSFREESRAKAKNISIDELQSQIEAAIEVLNTAPTIEMANHSVVFIEEPNLPPELAEASARIAKPYVYLRTERDGRKKSGVRSAPVEVVKAFIENCDLNDIYGDPHRGFAGGYF